MHFDALSIIVGKLPVLQKKKSNMFQKLEGNDCIHIGLQNSESSQGRVKYGELVVLGHNGSLPQRDRGRRRSKLVLYKRDRPNGIKMSRYYVVETPHKSQAVLDTKQYSISYTLSSSEAIIVEYQSDENTDMFQIGRSSEPSIDFVVMGTPGAYQGGDGKEEGESRTGRAASTISRFACRILADRHNPSNLRIYAAGFDSSRNIFLGEKAPKWEEPEDQRIDGLTTNGVLLMSPEGELAGGAARPGLWWEVSVGGRVFTLRKSRSDLLRGISVEGASNLLKDGTLIDLCGATLLWRSAEGLAKTPTKAYLASLVEKVNVHRTLGTEILVIPRSRQDLRVKVPYVCLKCGQVQGPCDICFKCFGRVTKVILTMGIETAFYVDSSCTTFYAFNPCGHIATEKTVKYWASVPIPHGTSSFDSACPFCGTPIEDFPGYVKLCF